MPWGWVQEVWQEGLGEGLLEATLSFAESWAWVGPCSGEKSNTEKFYGGSVG